jgi:hypothetical protein
MIETAGSTCSTNGKPGPSGLSHLSAEGGTDINRRGEDMTERYRIHQVIPAAPGTRMLVRYTSEGPNLYEFVEHPVILFALVEDLVEGGDRFVVPMDQASPGMFLQTYEDSQIKRVLAPGEPMPPYEELERE